MCLISCVSHAVIKAFGYSFTEVSFTNVHPKDAVIWSLFKGTLFSKRASVEIVHSFTHGRSTPSHFFHFCNNSRSVSDEGTTQIFPVPPVSILVIRTEPQV